MITAHRRQHSDRQQPSVRIVRTERDVVRAIRTAGEEGRTIRAAGSCGSKNGAYHTRGMVVRTDALSHLVAIQGNLVTVSPGMTCGRLNVLLRDHGLVLPGVGEWECATIGGSIATATHGGSATHGIMATAVHALQFVDGQGQVHRMDRGHPDFLHVVVSLGAMGIVSAVTLECVPRFALRLDTDVVGFEEYARDPLAQESRTEFHASVWVPSAQRVIRFAADRTTGSGAGRRPLRFGPRTAIASSLSRTAHLHGAVSPAWFASSHHADCAAILSPIAVAPRVVRWIWSTAGSLRAAEFAFPAARAAEVLAALANLARQQPSGLANPVGLRVNAADRFSLSPCYGRATLWVDMFYRSTPAVDAALRALADRFDARCHWGKHLPIPASEIRTRYPRWNDFVGACRRYDPHERFANPLTTALGITTGGIQ